MLSYTARKFSFPNARTYESLFGLSIPKWQLAAVVAETGGISRAKIGTRTRMDKVVVSRAGITLVDRGLLARAQPR